MKFMLLQVESGVYTLKPIINNIKNNIKNGSLYLLAIVTSNMFQFSLTTTSYSIIPIEIPLNCYHLYELRSSLN